MNKVEVYTREVAKIFLQISDMIKAAGSDKALQKIERFKIILYLQSSRTMLAESLSNLIKLSLNHDEKCDIRQL